MSVLLNLLLPALMPALADGVRGVIARFTGSAGSRPANVAEAIQLMDAEARKLQALAALDAPAANISRWVADLRAAFRYIFVGVIVLATVAAAFIPEVPAPAMAALFDLTGACMSFIIGERCYLGLKK